MNTPAPPAPFLDYDKSLACIHCGLCLSSCPTYLETGNENDSPRGRIYLMRAIQDGRMELTATPVRHLDLCLGCRACEAVCPSGVRYGELLEATRNHVEKAHTRSPWQAFLRHYAIERIFPFPERMELALLPARALQRSGLSRWLPAFAREALSLIPEASPVRTLPIHSPPTAGSPRRGRVGFVSGCVMSVLFSETNAASVRLLNRAGYEVITPPAQGCCGALHAHGGNLDGARACARRNIETFESLGLDAILINAAGCGSTLKEYGHLLAHDPLWAQRGAAFSSKVRDLTECLAAVQAEQPEQPPTRPPARPGPADPADTGRVTYHDACHLAHAQRITRPPRDLVRAVAGERFVELPESDVCCGSAGSYNLTEPAMAQRLQRRKIQNILATGATTVVTSNPGCLLQLQAGLKKAGAPHIRVLHIADYLDAHRPGTTRAVH